MSNFRLEVHDQAQLRLVLDVLQEEDTFDIVGTGDSADAAVDLAASERPDVIVLDEAGFDDVGRVAERVRAESPTTRVLVLAESDGQIRASTARAAEGVVAAPMRPSRVVAEISALLASATRTVAAHLPSDPISAGQARRLINNAAAAWGVGGLNDTLALLATELVSNAVRHGDSSVEIVIRLEEHVVRVEVRDDSAHLPVTRPPTADAESGRGMSLVDALASAWGVTPTADGKCVWFELRR